MLLAGGVARPGIPEILTPSAMMATIQASLLKSPPRDFAVIVPGENEDWSNPSILEPSAKEWAPLEIPDSPGQNRFASPPNLTDLSDGYSSLPSVPWAGDSLLTGSLNSEQGWMTYRIPVGPMTKAVRIAVRPMNDGDAPASPLVDQMVLVDRFGTVLTELIGPANHWRGPTPDVLISLSGAPKGGQILIRIMAPQSVIVPGQTPETPVSWNVPYVLEVQRNDPSELSTLPLSNVSISFNPIVTPSFYLVGMGRLSGTTPTSPSLSSGSRTAYLDLTNDSSTLPGSPTQTARLAIAIDVSEPVSTGPLVSRGSAPLGPALATWGDEPTPPIERDERAFDFAIERLGADVTPELVLRRKAIEAGETDSGTVDPRRPISQAELTVPLISLRGAGGFPVLVSTLHGDRPKMDPALMLSTLSSQVELAEPLVDSSAVTPLAPLELPDRDRGKTEKLPCIDYLTAAWGLILGIGLISGPFYPDLLAMAKPRVPRRFRLEIGSGTPPRLRKPLLARLRQRIGLRPVPSI